MTELIFRPNRVVGLIVGGVGLALLIGLDVVFLLLLPQPPLGILNFLWGLLFVLSLPPIGLLAYRTYNLWQSAYRLGPDRLIVEWGARREIIPLREIREALAGRDIERDLRPRGLWWPGCIVGRLKDERLGEIEFLAAQPQDGQILVVTEGGSLALSPEPLAEFASALEERLGVRGDELEVGEEKGEVGGERLEVGSQKPEAEGVLRETIQPAFAEWGIWRDRWALGLLAAAALGVTALFAFVLLRLPDLPVTMTLHFAAAGEPDRTGAPRGLLILPLIGLLTLLVNGALGGLLHIRAGQRAAAYMLWGFAAFVQALVWIAALGLMARA